MVDRISVTRALGEAVYAARVAQGLSQNEAARHAGISERLWREIETNTPVTRVASLARVCVAVRMHPANAEQAGHSEVANLMREMSALSSTVGETASEDELHLLKSLSPRHINAVTRLIRALSSPDKGAADALVEVINSSLRGKLKCPLQKLCVRISPTSLCSGGR